MNAWLRQHRLALRDALLHIGRARGSFALNVVVIAIALALPLAGVTLVDNLQPVARTMAVAPAMSIFLAPGAPRESARALAPALQKILDASRSRGHVTFVAREAALVTLQDKSGMADVVAALGENPLPDAYVVTLDGVDAGVASPPGAQASRVDALVAEFARLPGVEQVQVDSDWIKRLAALLQVLRIAVLLLASALAVVVVAVVFNTIRLQVMTQHEEIGVARLVGATDRFIYRPVYYTGALLGCAAGVMALAAVALSLQPLNGAIAELMRLYDSQFRLTPLEWPQSLLLLAASAVLGLAGSALSVRRHLARAD